MTSPSQPRLPRKRDSAYALSRQDPEPPSCTPRPPRYGFAWFIARLVLPLFLFIGFEALVRWIVLVRDGSDHLELADNMRTFYGLVAPAALVAMFLLMVLPRSAGWLARERWVWIPILFGSAVVSVLFYALWGLAGLHV